MNIRIPLFLFFVAIASMANADSYQSAELVDSRTAVVTFASGIKIEFGRNSGESLSAFKVRVKSMVIEILSVLNAVPSRVDITADLQ